VSVGSIEKGARFFLGHAWFISLLSRSIMQLHSCRVYAPADVDMSQPGGKSPHPSGSGITGHSYTFIYWDRLAPFPSAFFHSEAISPDFRSAFRFRREIAFFADP
jgi:hypothetical protein